jgi:hypothetical protein
MKNWIINLFHLIIVASILCSLTKNIKPEYDLLSYKINSKYVKNIMNVIITVMVITHSYELYKKIKQ